jgi:hypothetical protein
MAAKLPKWQRFDMARAKYGQALEVYKAATAKRKEAERYTSDKAGIAKARKAQEVASQRLKQTEAAIDRLAAEDDTPKKQKATTAREVNGQCMIEVKAHYRRCSSRTAANLEAGRGR